MVIYLFTTALIINIQTTQPRLYRKRFIIIRIACIESHTKVHSWKKTYQTLDQSFPLKHAALADWISYSQIGFLLVKGDIYRTRRQSLYYSILSGNSFLECTKHGGDTRLAIGKIVNIDCQMDLVVTLDLCASYWTLCKWSIHYRDMYLSSFWFSSSRTSSSRW